MMNDEQRKKRGMPPREKEMPSDTYLGIEAFFHASDGRIVERYKTIPLNQALFELGRLRRSSELASEAINRRTIPDETKCWICGRNILPGQKIAMMHVDVDKATGTQTPRPICSMLCVRELNRKVMGWNGIPDRGEAMRDKDRGEVSP